MFFVVRKLTCFPRLQNCLRKFTNFSFLIISLLGEQVQSLSFKCFSQFYDLRTGSNYISDCINLVVSHTVLFLCLIYAVGSAWVLPVLAPRHRKMLYDGFHIKLKTAAGQTILLLTRFVGGYTHSLLYERPQTQIAILLLLQLAGCIVICVLRNCYTRKTTFVCHLLQFIFRTVLYLQLLGEMWLSKS